MEKKPRYFLVGGNGELTEETTSEKLPKLSDKDIDKLYSKLIKLDGKYKNFKGSKRDYCFTVSGLIINFLKGNNLLGKEGGAGKKKKELTPAQIAANKAADKAKAIEDARIAKEAEDIEAYSKLTPEQQKEVWKSLTPEQKKRYSSKISAKKQAIKRAENQEYLDIPIKEGDWTEADVKEYFDKRTKTHNITKGELTGKYYEKIVPGLNDILTENPYKNNITYSDIAKHANKYKKVLELFCDGSGNQDIVSTKNFLLLAPFDEIFLNTTKGNEQKQTFRTLLKEYERGTGYKPGDEWKQADTATIITETDYYNNYLKGKGFGLLDKEGKKLDDDMANVLMNAKLYSKFRSSGNIDFQSKNKIVELKGNTKNIRHQNGDPRCQVDLSKVLGSIYNLFYIKKNKIRTGPKQGSIDFYNFTSENDIINSKQSHLCTISLDILKLYKGLSDTTKNLIKTTLKNDVAPLDLSNDQDTFKYTALLKIKPNTGEKQKELLESLKTDIFKYFQGDKFVPQNQIMVAKTDDQMLNLAITNPIIRNKLYLTQINTNLGLKGNTQSELLADYCKFLNETGDDCRRLKLLEKITNPGPEDIIPKYTEPKIEIPEKFNPKEYFYKKAKEILKEFVDNKNYTEAEIEEIIEDKWDDADPKPVSEEDCEELSYILYDEIKDDLEEPEYLDPEEEAKLKKKEKREELKTTIRNKRKILEQKYNIITDTDWNTFTEEEKKEIEDMVDFHNSITKLKTKTDSELDEIEVELDKDIERIKNITNPPKPDQPVVAAGRRFYFRRF